MLTSKIFQSSLKAANKLTFENVIVRQNSASAAKSLEESYFRTSEGNPSNHGLNHLGRIYTVDPEIPKIFGKELNPKENYYANNYFGPRRWVDRLLNAIHGLH